MNTYFNNGGILENLPLNPVNKNLKTNIYIVAGLATVAIIGFIAANVKVQELRKDLKDPKTSTSNPNNTTVSQQELEKPKLP